MARRHNATGRSGEGGKFVQLHRWFLDTDAWRDLDPVARCAYIEISRRYGGPGSNNGRISFSIREMAERLNVSKATAARAFERLQDHGFIAQTRKGAFSVKVRVATEWRLTEFADDVTGELATKDFTRWKKQKTVSPEGPNGPRNETVRSS
ncbi:MarR family transcriptional regulator [Parvibaculum sp.]|uniref:MarR family transcriptional regulator n=1 Tax=Parvibaculum sp. TaxID=2024848 RepID=UPI003211391B